MLLAAKREVDRMGFRPVRFLYAQSKPLLKMYSLRQNTQKTL